ncbi:MAG: dockerin type I domain-containing protein [Patescibacteria group bacterium]
MKKLFLFSVVLFVVSYLLAFTAAKSAKAQNSEQNACADAYGNWREFTASCIDSCVAARTPNLQCAVLSAFSCDCGENHCWNGFKCETNGLDTCINDDNCADNETCYTPDPPNCPPNAYCIPPLSKCVLNTHVNKTSYSKADLNRDGQINIMDYTIFKNLFQNRDMNADMNEDNQINILDYAEFKRLFNQ